MSLPAETVPGPDYLRWNDAITAHFFNTESAGQRVHLEVDEDLVGEIGASLGGGLADLVAAVLTGPPWVPPWADLCQRALAACDGWRDRRREYPPYVAYLAVFVLAAGVEGEFAAQAYYPRLRALLGMEPGGTLPHFDRMFELWDDLEIWSVRDCQGRFGVFEAVVSGGWFHVGLPLAQATLTTGERRGLPRLFAAADLDPIAVPTTSELLSALRMNGPGILRPRTLALVESGTGNEATSALLDAVAEEFASWDGEVPAGPETEDVPAGHVLGRLRICLAFDPIARRAAVTLRANSNRPFPDEPLLLAAGPESPVSRCDVATPGWSEPLAETDTGEPVRPSPAQWSGGMRLADRSQRWDLRLLAAQVRIFVGGEAAGLPGLVETHRLPRAQEFHIAFANPVWGALRPWLEGCPGWRLYGTVEGLPPGWQFGSALAAHGAGPTRFESLRFADRLRLRLIGGLRSAAGNTYFSFALPSVLIEGGSGGEELFCNDARLAGLGIGRAYEIPASPDGGRITLEVRQDERVLARSSIFPVAGFNWHVRDPIEHVDRFGRPGASAEPWICGAVVGGAPRVAGIAPDPLRAPGLHTASGRVFFVGRRPDQIRCWPAEPVPDSWVPIWAVSLRRRGHAVYCGPGTEDATPLPVTPGAKGDPRWRHVLWGSRRRVSPPAGPVSSLWIQYQEAARRDRSR